MQTFWSHKMSISQEDNKTTIRAVFFDLDGTLVDTPKGIVVAFKAALNDLGKLHVDEAEIRATIGLPLPEAFKKLLGKDLNESLVEEGIDLYQSHFRNLVLPRAAQLVFPDVHDGLQELSDRGMHLAVVTNKFHATAEQLLISAGLQSVFQLVVGADQVTRPKPHPEMGYLALSKFDLAPSQTIMVGDTVHDLKMASNAGMRSIAVTYGIHSFTQLISANPTWIERRFKDVVRRISSSDKPTLTV